MVGIEPVNGGSPYTRTMSSESADSLRSLDLPQLQALHALLAERSVTGAAKRLGRTQPTLSTALARLRRHFGDELLTRNGNHYGLTPFAEHLRPLTSSAVTAVERVFAARSEFVPATSDRTFTLMSSDYGISVIGARLLARLERDAPGTSVRFEPVAPDVLGRNPDYFRTVDGVLMPHGFIPLPHSLDLFLDRWVCIVASGNRSVGDRLTMDDLARLSWVTTFHDPLGRSPAWRQMELLGVVPRVSATTTSFLALPRLVQQTGGAALIQHRLVDGLADELGVRVLECPFDAVPLVEAFWWHPVHHADAQHVWLRAVLGELVCSFDLPGAG